MKHILLCLIFVLQTSLLFETGLLCDYIYINGEKWFLMDKPLERDSTVYANLKKYLPEGRIMSTANWDGYTGHWIVIDGKIYLQKIDVDMYSSKGGEDYTLTYTTDSLKKVFTSYSDEKGICAKWLNGTIRSGQGKIIRYVHSGFNRNMEKEHVMYIRNGVIVGQELYHNWKKEGIALLNARWELEKRFPFERFPEMVGKRIVFIIRDLEMFPDGHFRDCRIDVRLPDTENYVNDQQHPVIKAFKAVMKDIYPWEVLYLNGKYTMDCISYGIPLQYPILTAHTTEEYREPGVPVCYLNTRKDTIIPFGKYKYFNSDTIRHIGFVVDKEIVCIDNKGNELFDVFCFDNSVDPVKEGLFRIKDKTGKIGFADTLGNIIIKPQFAFAYPFENGKAKVTYSGKKSFIDKQKEHWKWESDFWFYIDRN